MRNRVLKPHPLHRYCRQHTIVLDEEGNAWGWADSEFIGFPDSSHGPADEGISCVEVYSHGRSRLTELTVVDALLQTSPDGQRSVWAVHEIRDHEMGFWRLFPSSEDAQRAAAEANQGLYRRLTGRDVR